MEFTYGDIWAQNQEVAETKTCCLDKLRSTSLDGVSTNSVRKFLYRFKQQSKVLQKKYDEILKDYSELDKDGNIIPEQNRFGCKLKSDANVREIETRLTVLRLEKFSLPADIGKIPYSLLMSSSTNFSAADIDFLEPFLEGHAIEVSN